MLIIYHQKNTKLKVVKLEFNYDCRTLLARFGKGYIPQPGGDKIGRRRLDTHFTGFEKLGAQFIYDGKEEFYKVEGENLKETIYC